MKPILTETEVYYKPVMRYFRNPGARMHTDSPQFLTHTLKNTRAYFPHVYPCLCSVLLPVDGGLRRPPGKGLRAPKCCFSPHYCQGIHRWLMMDYISASARGFPPARDLQQLRALAALAATLTMASTAQGISRRTFSLLSPRVHRAAVSQEMHGGRDEACALF